MKNEKTYDFTDPYQIAQYIKDAQKPRRQSFIFRAILRNLT